ncbi:AraC family transcriptional regulator [Clostridium sp. SYSU_GA19001]|uniref:AraC family transcriptional regulator n=1 Tax=Clostridium caldaquaticum TaxID=2940653 RepID=UPI002076E8CC|nr:AraC family transcriptional regulator [Clostridium caldaquaticum]MCM8710731.1 AraC family transcriptional regulator [Clostridium caldaquaticum]
MNRIELNKFLRKHTLLEDTCLELSSNKNIMPKVLPEMDFFLDEDSTKKFPFINKGWDVDFIINPEKSFKNKTAIHPKEGIIFACHPRFSSVTEHHHNYIEMTYVYSGKCHQIINGKHITLNKGEVCILDTNVLHSIIPADENDIIINCMMSKNYLDNILLSRLSGNDLLSSFFIRAIYQSNDFNDYIIFNSGKSEKLTNLMEDVLCEFFDKSLCSDEVINSYMIIIFSELVRIFAENTNSQNYNNLRNTKISDIILYIENNCKNATLASTAEHFHFHPNYLSSIIKKFIGRKFTHILQEAKLKKAGILLKNSDMSVAEIAREIGYENTNFFYDIFKRHYGCTPTEYRKNL